MIATGNHRDFDSLRDAPRPYPATASALRAIDNRPYQAFRIRLTSVKIESFHRRAAGDGCPYERDEVVGNGFIRSVVPGAVLRNA